MTTNATVSAVFYGAGYLTGLAAFVGMARGRRMATEGVWRLCGAGLLGGLVFANLAQQALGGAPGKTVLGGVAGGWLTVLLYKRSLGLRRPTGDLFAVALCAGEAVGRWGCFFGGCCYGRPTTVAWAVYQHGALRHPTQIYLSLACLLLLAALWRFARRDPPENALFYLQGLLYCAARFTIEFFRDAPPSFGPLTTAQWACLGGFLFFAARWRSLSRAPERIENALS